MDTMKSTLEPTAKLLRVALAALGDDGRPRKQADFEGLKEVVGIAAERLSRWVAENDEAEGIRRIFGSIGVLVLVDTVLAAGGIPANETVDPITCAIGAATDLIEVGIDEGAEHVEPKGEVKS